MPSQHDRLSLPINHDTADLMSITSLSMVTRAQAVVDRADAEKVLGMLPLKYPEAKPLLSPMKMLTPDEVRLFRVTPSVISVQDYSKGFGYTELVTCCWACYRPIAGAHDSPVCGGSFSPVQQPVRACGIVPKAVATI